MTKRFRLPLAALILFILSLGLNAGRSPALHSSIHFCAIGDRTGGATGDVYERVWREISLLHPDFVFNVGDTIERRSQVPPEQQWKELRSLWHSFGDIPFYLTPGNHDIYSDESRRTFQQVIGRQAHYSFTAGPVHVVVLDNSVTWDLDHENLQFLKDDLERNREAPVKIVTFHKPFWIKLFKQGQTGFPLHTIAKQYGVNFVFSGHGHQLVRAVHDGITYMERQCRGRNRRGTQKGRFPWRLVLSVRLGHCDRLKSKSDN